MLNSKNKPLREGLFFSFSNFLQKIGLHSIVYLRNLYIYRIINSLLLRWYNLIWMHLLVWGPCVAGNLSALKMHRLEGNKGRRRRRRRSQVGQWRHVSCLGQCNTWPTNHSLAYGFTLECPVCKFTNPISSFC